jgi:hypothetical protein
MSVLLTNEMPVFECQMVDNPDAMRYNQAYCRDKVANKLIRTFRQLHRYSAEYFDVILPDTKHYRAVVSGTPMTGRIPRGDTYIYVSVWQQMPRQFGGAGCAACQIAGAPPV